MIWATQFFTIYMGGPMGDPWIGAYPQHWYLVRSPLLLMNWWCKKLGHQQPWYFSEDQGSIMAADALFWNIPVAPVRLAYVFNWYVERLTSRLSRKISSGAFLWMKHMKFDEIFLDGLLIYQILALFWLSETGQIQGFRAFPGECMEGMAWNFACCCILATFRTD